MAEVPRRCGLDHDVDVGTRMYEVWFLDRPQSGIPRQKPDIPVCCIKCGDYIQKKRELPPPERRDGPKSETRDHADKRLGELRERGATTTVRPHFIGHAGSARPDPDQPARQHEGKVARFHHCDMNHPVDIYGRDKMNTVSLTKWSELSPDGETTVLGTFCDPCASSMDNMKPRKRGLNPDRVEGLLRKRKELEHDLKQRGTAISKQRTNAPVIERADEPGKPLQGELRRIADAQARRRSQDLSP